MLMDRPSIAAKIGSRTGKQCRERYRNHLSPDINHAPWSSEEDELLIRLHNSLGRHWTKFVGYLPGRSDNAVKNRWKCLQKAIKMGCKPRHYPRRASRALFLDNNYVHQANGFSHNDIYQANSASSDSSLSLSMIDEEIVDEDFCEWIIRELSQLDDGSAHLERANHSLNLTDGPGVADAAAVSFVDVAAINSPMPQVSSHANTPGTAYGEDMTSLSDVDAMKADMDFSFCDDPLLFDDDCFCLFSLFDVPFDLPLP